MRSASAGTSVGAGVGAAAVLAGAVALVWHNWRQWRRETALLAASAPAAGTQAFSHATWPRLPRVSALVAAWNERGTIDEHIRSFLTLSYGEKELVLCAGGEDGTYRMAQRWAGPGVKVLEQLPGEGKQAALQRCLAEATGEVIVLSDADCVFTDEAWNRLLEPLARGIAQVVTGVSEPRADQRDRPLVRYQWYGDVYWAHRMPETVDGVLGRNCALLRPVLHDVGGFEAPAATGTDYVLSRLLEEAGYTIFTAPGSRIATEYPESPVAYLAMWRRWNKNLVLQGLRFGAWRHVRGLLAAGAVYGLVVVMLASSAVLGTAGWGGSLLVFGAAAANRLRRYALGARLVHMEMALAGIEEEVRSSRLPFGLEGPTILRGVAYTALDMLAVLLALYDSLDPRRRRRW